MTQGSLKVRFIIRLLFNFFNTDLVNCAILNHMYYKIIIYLKFVFRFEIFTVRFK